MTYITNNYPTSIQTAVDPTATDPQGTFDHAGLETFQNDSIDALKAKVGIDSSAVTTSHDYKLSGVTGSDKSASLAGIETLSNKTLTTPKIVTGGSITDENGNKQIEFVTTTSAVNDIKVTNSATGNAPTISASGTDSNIDIAVKGKGTGSVKLGTVGLKFPNTDGAANQVLKTDGAGQMSWVSASSGSTAITSVPKITLGLNALTNIGFVNNTFMYFALVDIPESITANKLSMWINSYTSSGTIRFALFSQDGQTQVIPTTTTATISAGSQQITTSLASPVSISAGKYYIAFLYTGTSNFEVMRQDPSANASNLNFVTGKYYYSGYKTVTASTMPSTFDPTASVTAERYAGLYFRLDN